MYNHASNSLVNNIHAIRRSTWSRSILHVGICHSLFLVKKVASFNHVQAVCQGPMQFIRIITAEHVVKDAVTHGFRHMGHLIVCSQHFPGSRCTLNVEKGLVLSTSTAVPVLDPLVWVVGRWLGISRFVNSISINKTCKTVP